MEIIESKKALLFPGIVLTEELMKKTIWIAEQILNSGSWLTPDQAVEQAANYCNGNLHIYPAIGVSSKDQTKVFELQNNLKYPALGEVCRLYGKYSSITAYITDYTKKDQGSCTYNLAPTEVQRLYNKIKRANLNNTSMEEKLIKVYDSIEKAGKYKGKSMGALFTLKRSLLGSDGKEAKNKWSVNIAKAYGMKSQNGNFWNGKPDIELQLFKYMDDNMIEDVFKEACEVIRIYLNSPYIQNMLRVETMLIQESKEIYRQRYIGGDSPQDENVVPQKVPPAAGNNQNAVDTPTAKHKSMKIIMADSLREAANDLKVATVNLAEGANKDRQIELYIPLYRYEFSKDKITQAVITKEPVIVSYEIVNVSGTKYCYFVD